MTLDLSRSLFWKLFMPVGAMLLICGVAASVFLPARIQANAERQAVDAAEATARQFLLLRKYYTENVTSKILAQSTMRVGFDHQGDPRTVPLPATMIHDLSLLMQQSGTAFKLYSPYPFPNRRERVNDQFAQDAWTFLQAHPERSFTRTEWVAGKTVVRVAVADRMAVPACVACHNSLATSPKKDWKLGDVRGVLEISSSKELANSEAIVTQVLATLGAIMLLLAVFVRVFYQRNVARPLNTALEAARGLTAAGAEKVKAAEAIADGKLDAELALTPLPEFDARQIARDEVGELLGSIVSMSRAQRALDQAFGKMTVSLRHSRDGERARDWLKSGQNELNVLMRGDHEVALLAERVLAFLVERVGAAVGAFYLHDEHAGVLGLAAGFARAPGSEPAASVAAGEGLVGQAMRSRKTLHLAQVPPGYLQVASGLGHAAPAEVLVLPLTHGENLVGAIELATLVPFSALEREFLDLVREAVAIGFEVNLARQRTRALLEETEQQAEELRVQQEELQQSNEELEERAELLERQREQIRAKNVEVEQASRDIWHKAEQLQKVSAYKSEFLANMSHELRTPLNSMLILSSLLKENKGNKLSAKQVEYAATIHGAGKDLLNLINDILDLSKVEAGQVEFHYEQTEARALCDAMQGLFGEAARQKGLAMDAAVAPGMPAAIRVDVQRTSQVLKNLLANAVKFTAQGRVGLRIALAAADDNPLPVPAIACAVSDTGIGVAPDKQALIFEAFRQADGAISRSFGGTGLGLSISLQLARRMGGELRVRSVEGEGSVFTLYLPLSPPDGVVVAAPAPAPAPEAPVARAVAAAPALPDDRAQLAPQAKSILIVEDDVGFARVLMDFVRARGFAALVATDGVSGCALAQQYRPSAVLLDVMLPQKDGWEVMATLKRDPRTRAIPVHFISCLEDWQKAMDMGAVGFVSKPVSAEQLNAVLDTIESALAKALKRLLIVEDDRGEAQSLLALLSERDVEITLAADGEQALALLGAGSFDCMVLDLGLAGMSGFEVLDRVQRIAGAASMPVIIHSGLDLTREQQRELNRYAERIVIKGAHSPQRLLDEVTLFLHMVDGQLGHEPQALAPAAGDAALEGKKVLIVDDDMRNIFSLTSLLADKGMQVVEAEHGGEALARLAEHPDVQVVLMDIMMPHMDGYEAMRRIRAGHAAHAVPIIAMTAKAMPGDQQKCLEAGASDYLSKPVDTEKLLTLLRVWTCS